MKKSLPANEPIVIEVERDLRKNIRNINQRFNDSPDVAKLILINPILALQEIGVELSDLAKQHVMDSLRFPSGWIEKRDQAAKELQNEFVKFHIQEKLPLSNTSRAHILFNIIKIKAHKEDSENKNNLPPDRLPYYRKKHPLIDKIIEYERLKRGRLLFQTKEVFEDYKSGKRKLKWIKSVRFNF
jgi:hypothetical protein